MDVSEKEEFATQKRNGDSNLNYDSVDNNTDWRVSAPIDSYPPHSLISSCPSSSPPSQMMESFGQTLWYDPTNVQPVSYGGFNVQSNANASSFRDRSLEMNWNGSNLLPKGNALFLPNASTFLPPSIAQFPADSGFIERAARFSLFSSGNFSDMVNQPLGNPDSIGLFLQSGAQGMQIRSGAELVQCPSNELTPNDASTTGKGTKPNVPGSGGNVSEDTQSSGGNGQNERQVKAGETSSKGFNTKKRKRQGQDSEAGQSHRCQQSGEEPDSNGDEKKNDEQSPNSPANKTNSGKKQTSDPPKDGYIHVRARRGQATNSHSLAERVRREKISERMKFLQDLVPGCNKVTGKAVMLDEIINYVQSLQRQVEFLSMKLATVNPQMDFNLEGLLTKDATLQLRPGPSSGPQFPQNVSVVYPSLPHGFMHQTLSSIGDPSVSSPLSQPMNGGFKRQETHGAGGWEGDLQNVIHMNYGSVDVPAEPQAATAAANTNMKVEP